MLLDRKISVLTLGCGVLLLIGSLAFDWGRENQGALMFLAIDCNLFSLLSALDPRTDADLKHGAIESLKFVGMSLAVLAFIGGLVYLLVGSAGLGTDEGLMAVFIFGLPAALVLPPVLRRLYRNRREGGLGS